MNKNNIKILFIAVALINLFVSAYNYNDSSKMDFENKNLLKRNNELKQIAINLNQQLRQSAVIKSGLIYKIGSLSKKDTVYIQKQSRNEKTLKKDIAVIDTVNVNELIRLFTN